MEFIAIDVETANADMASICQVGLVYYADGVLAGEWKSYVDPEDYFDPMNVSIHGIDEETVAGQPTLPAIAEELSSYLTTRLVVSHTHFDRVAVHQAFGRYGLEEPACVWLDSARITRRTWSEFASRGYGLHNVCRFLGYEFSPHDALEDAKAAGHIVLKAIETSGLSIEEWLVRVERPIGGSGSKVIWREGNPDGPLFGEVLVFTGSLEMPRRDAADLAACVGCTVAPEVNKKTTILVVGDQDVRKLAGHAKSKKYRKAEELVAAGQPIWIIMESDFAELVALYRQAQ